MAQGTLVPTPFLIAVDANGTRVSGAKAFWYLAGTSTAVAVYQDVGLTTAYSQGHAADSAGRFAEIYLSPGAAYKLDLQTPAGASLPGYPADNILSVPTSAGNTDIQGTAGQAITAGQAVYLAADTSGGNTPGLWYKADSGNAYSNTLPQVGIAVANIASAAIGAIRLGGQATGLSSLTVGSTYYIGTAGALTATAPANFRAMGVADSTTTLIMQVAASGSGFDFVQLEAFI